MLGPEKLQLFPPEDWSDFESMIADLVEAELGKGKVQKHGRKGQNQFGVDLIGRPLDGGIIGVQCKKKDVIAGHTVTLKELRGEVNKAKKFRPTLSEFLLTTTAPDDGALQREALRLTNLHTRQGLFSVRVEGWNSIKSRFAEHPQIYHKYYGAPASTMTFAFQTPVSPVKELKPNPRDTKRNLSPLILPHRLSHAFGLLAAISVPLTRSMLSSLILSIDWGATLRELVKADVVESTEEGFRARPAVKQSFFRTRQDQVPFDEEWVLVLEPLRHHIDTGLLLVTVYVRLQRVSDAISLVTELAKGVEPGPWTETLWGVIRVLAKDAYLAETEVERPIVDYVCGCSVLESDQPILRSPCLDRETPQGSGSRETVVVSLRSRPPDRHHVQS